VPGSTRASGSAFRWVGGSGVSVPCEIRCRSRRSASLARVLSEVGSGARVPCRWEGIHPCRLRLAQPSDRCGESIRVIDFALPEPPGFPVQGNLQRCMPSRQLRARPARPDRQRHPTRRGGPPRTATGLTSTTPDAWPDLHDDARRSLARHQAALPLEPSWDGARPARKGCSACGHRTDKARPDLTIR